MLGTAYFTICSANYLGYALTLAQSLRRIDPVRRLVVFLTDRLPADVAIAIPNVEIVPIERLPIDGLLDMAFRYSILEFNTAVKPRCFEYLLTSRGFSSAIYLDPDVLVVNPLDHVHEALDRGASCIMTPHITLGLDDGKRPSEDTFLTCGVFNLGFAAFSNAPEALSFLTWWGGKTRRDCVIALHRGIFTDQSYCDLAPCFIDRFVTLRHTGYNIAYWNLMQRRLAHEGGQLHVDGELARFIHFSGIVPGSPSIFSKHQNRYSRSNIGPLKPVADSYVADLNRADLYPGGRFSRLAYAFGTLNNGDPITDAMRSAYRKFADELPAGLSPFDLDHTQFMEPDRQYPQFPGVVISRLYGALWEDRSDLRSLFDIHTRSGQCEFSAWAAENLSKQTGLSARYLSHVGRQGVVTTAPEAPDALRRASKDEIFDRATSSSSFMIRNLLRRHLMGKSRIRAYWQRRVHPTPTAAPVTRDVLASGVDMFGYFRTESGIGQGARGFASAIQAENIRLNTTNLRLPDDFVNSVDFEDIFSGEPASAALICANADTIVNLNQLIDPRRLEGRYKVGHWAWELPVFPAAWSSACDRIDEIWAPSQFVARAIQPATTKPVRIVPYVVEQTPLEMVSARREIGLPTDAYLFMTALDLNSFSARKNPLGAIRAFRAAFPNGRDPSPRLIVKLHGKDRVGNTRKALAEAIQGDPRINLIDAVYSAARLQTLRAACNAFVSLHRSEGFGLNIAEAMAAGRLAIATDFSGSQDFLRSDNGLPIPYTMRAVKPDEYLFGAGQWWAEPDHDAAVGAMRWAVDNIGAGQRLADRARQDMQSRYSAASIGRIVSEALAGRSSIPLA